MNGNDPVHPSYFFPEQYNPEFGLTKRELIAAMAMQGMLSNYSWLTGELKEVADLSVQQADALIERLNADPVAEGLNLLPMYSHELDEGLTDDQDRGVSR
jgi:hypothetical protein